MSIVGGRITFASDRDGNPEIYVMNADGTSQTNLTNNPSGDYMPDWSPDGNRIVFYSNRDGNFEIYVMNADGSGQTNISNNSVFDFAPVWSPDGNRIAFTSDRDGNFEIYVMSADGSDQTNISNDSAWDYVFSWSPDGKHIAFTSDRNNNAEIYVMNADGSGQVRLTDNPAEDSFPAWSPDGSRIVFESSRDGNAEIYVMNADGSSQVRLTDNLAWDAFPAWSPDGNHIVFESNRDGNAEIYVMNTDGSGQVRLTQNSALDAVPSWSPDVRRLVLPVQSPTLTSAAQATGAQPVADDSNAPFDKLEGSVPFTNVAPQALLEKSFVQNRYPGVAIFDYDRDGDMDFYVTQAENSAITAIGEGGSNRLFRNDGDGIYTDVAKDAGVAAAMSNSSGVAACDLNNDGYQDLYVGAHGRVGDELDYRSASAKSSSLWDVIKDRLFLNNRDGTFTDITEPAFGEEVNTRSAMAVACADIDGDGWLDIFVGNRADVDFVKFNRPKHHGHYNALFRNNANLTFTNVAERAGVLGPQIVMRTTFGEPITYEDPSTGEWYEGYDPNLNDADGNQIGDPTGQTWSVLFYDYDSDGDQDLWVADDGDRLKAYRNDSTSGDFRFTPIGRAMGIDQSGAWMGFALGDYDSDADLDIFVTNIGFHPLLSPPPPVPGGDCAYSHQFSWGTCGHYLLRNDGLTAVRDIGTIGKFANVAPSIVVKPSRLMPPASLEPLNIHPNWQLPKGLAAYDFGFGATFFDYDNDTDQDLYWLGSMIARGEGPRGNVAPAAGRMLRNERQGVFQDLTVELRLLDIQEVDYSLLDPADPRFNADRQRIGAQFHENGKGLAKCDLDGDGYVDLIGTNSSGHVFETGGEVGFAQGPLFVWMNGNQGNHWIGFRLQGRMAIDGTGSNADGIGARIYVTALAPDGGTHTQVQEITASGTFLSMNCLQPSFGLGEAESVKEIRIRWPSGVEQTLADIDAGQVLLVVEPER